MNDVSATAGVALITGSGRHRVGNVIAQELARHGYAIAIHYHRSRDAAFDTVGRLRELGVPCDAWQADVSDEGQVRTMLADVVQRFGRLDVLVTTASIWESRPLEQTSADDLRRSFDVNTLGTFLCAQQAGLIMARQQQGGAIVTVGDWAVQRPYLDHAAYFIAKGAIPTLTRCLAVELATRNPRVRVNCVHPGPVMFPPEATSQQRQEMVESTLVKSADCPQALAQAVKFLIDNPFVTGTCIAVDGGRSIFAGEAAAGKRPI